MHGREFGGIAVALEISSFEATKAVLGGKRATHFDRDVVHDILDSACRLFVSATLRAFWRVDIEMQIAVTKVPKAVDPIVAVRGKCACGPRNKVGNRAER